jgi:hypothetical protein
MGKVYRCPNCNGTEIIWDAGLRKAACPKDKTPLNNYKTENNA